MAQQTAVEWLVDRIAEKSAMEKDRYYIPYNSGTIDITDLIEQAKQMEKQQTEEISDKEIEKASLKVGYVHRDNVMAFQTGANWYREQLKKAE